MTRNTQSAPFLRGMNLFSGLLLATLLVLFAGFLRYSWVAERDNKVQELSSILRFGADFSEIYFERIVATHRRLGFELLQQEGQVSADRAEMMLNNYKRTNPDQMGFSLLSSEGEVIADTDRSHSRPHSSLFSDMPVRQFQPGKQHEERLEFEPFRAEISGENLILPLRYAIRNGAGELRYLVRSRLRLGLLQNFWKTALVPQESALGFLENSGYLITRYSANPGVELERALAKPGSDELLSHLQQAGFPTSGYVEVQQKGLDSDQLIVFRRLTYHPVTLFISLPLSSIRAGWWARVRVPFVLVLALLVAGVVTYRLTVTKRQAERVFSRKQAELQDVTQGVLVAQEQERARISHELHDEIGQSLTALKITLNRIQQNLSDHEKAGALLTNGQHMVEAMVVDVREIAYRLRPSELDQLGLVAALRAHLDKTIRPLLQNVSLVENLGDKRLPPELELCCFRVVQEALTNCLRHAKATRLEISLTCEIPQLTLSIKDNGVGFDVARYDSNQEQSGTLGLVGMRERVAANGGLIRIRTLPEGGTEVTAIFDIAGEA